jgi:tRNA-splicing ligase RtcB (3'-phosphate/5'-hydroxy nucleic acid ligase)
LAPINTEVGRRYLGVMRAVINCALANREILGQYTRRVFSHFFPDYDLRLLSMFPTTPARLNRTRSMESGANSSSTAKAQRACGPGHETLPAALRAIVQPVLIGGSMRTASFIGRDGRQPSVFQ